MYDVYDWCLEHNDMEIDLKYPEDKCVHSYGLTYFLLFVILEVSHVHGLDLIMLWYFGLLSPVSCIDIMVFWEN